MNVSASLRPAADGCLGPKTEVRGFSEDLIVETDGMTLARWHMKKLECADALGSWSIRVIGPHPLARALPTWNRRGFQTERRYEEVRVG
jgi:hypothetical protein